MARRLIECVPNFSEGRDRTVIEAIVSAASSVAGAAVLAYECDADHHRSVVAIAGSPDAVEEAAFRAVAEAVRRIDLNQHAGVHPRIGAADVVPFVPVEGVAMEDCVAIAHRFGERVWRDLRVPVYFYEQAARHPDRRRLENVRRGRFEGLRDEVRRNTDRRPDIGEPELHPTAGAVAIGARKYLLAFNINLATADVSIADRIARRIRQSSGGLPHVKAMGVLLESRGLAQVSMNLTDFEVTPLHAVFEAVRREAAALGVEIAGSEIIGLMPAAALAMSAAHFLQCENYSVNALLERRIAAKVID
ncbi:MAG: glutamate formimidoyltransferase [Bryobacterales bacterium]|nr:glutamate formimidoyltransferase [Bryobacterales bacterium]